jgi:hypothetical protein
MEKITKIEQQIIENEIAIGDINGGVQLSPAIQKNLLVSNTDLMRKLRHENERLNMGLKFYAEKNHIGKSVYHEPLVEDMGEFAREILNETEVYNG